MRTVGRWTGIAVTGLGLCASAGLQGGKPRVASMNLCTDRLVMALADPDQIVSLSVVAVDPDSMVVTAGEDVPLNHGRLEELLAYPADLIVASEYDSPRILDTLEHFSRRVERFESAATLEQAAVNLERMAELLEQPLRGQQAASTVRQLGNSRYAGNRPRALILGANGYISGRESLAGDLAEALGYNNVAGEAGITQYGQLSIEQIILLEPDVMILNHYSGDYSRAQALLDHPVLQQSGRTLRVVKVPTREWICGDPALAHAAERLAR